MSLSVLPLQSLEVVNIYLYLAQVCVTLLHFKEFFSVFISILITVTEYSSTFSSEKNYDPEML